MYSGFHRMVEIQLSHVPESQRKALLRRAEGGDTLIDGTPVDGSESETKSGETSKERQGRPWYGNSEKEITALVDKWHKSLRISQEGASHGECSEGASPTFPGNLSEVKRNEEGKEYIDRKFVRVWSVCETVVDLDGRQSYRELKRLEGVTYEVATKICSLANRCRTRGNRLCIVATHYLSKVSPGSMLLDKNRIRPQLTWKKSGKGPNPSDAPR